MSRFVLLSSFVLIVIGLSMILCADRVGEAENAPLVSEAPQAAEFDAPPSVLAEEAPVPEPEAPAVSEVEIPPVSASALVVSEAPQDVAAPVSEGTGVPPEGGEVISAVVSAAGSPAEKTAEETAEALPPPETADVSEADDYFSDALFIGDSRTQGLLLYSNLSNAGYYAARGLTVEQVFKKAVVDFEGGKLTVSEALGRRTFGKVYLMFGLNELGWNSAEKFIEQYGFVLDRVRETQPDAVIYVQAIMPVSAWKSAEDPVHNNPNIDRFNAMILHLAAEKDAVFLNVGEGVADANGVLPDEASSDGIHLNKTYCIKWEAYLRAHEV
ncbi:MAG: GDSL-type esterase/lipase family protein [Clostridiales Family XIII bacterium]|nr:GDSL-type esterase/lipase family protein [Clostridiales Family XIII bacterium]